MDVVFRKHSVFPVSSKYHLFTSKLDVNLRKKLVCCICSVALYGAVTWTLRNVDKKYLKRFEMWCWRRTENISWTDGGRNEEVLYRSKEGRNILHAVKRRKANWIGHVWHRNCLLKHLIEGKIEEGMAVTGRQGRRRKQVLYDLKEARGYWELKEEALDRTQ
jgi:hypothetical protein